MYTIYQHMVQEKFEVYNIITGTKLISVCYTLRNEGTLAQKISSVIIYGWLTWKSIQIVP